jgi:hypothetical protein
MIIGIEGTGSQGWADADMTRSFVRRALQQSTIRPASYFIGPNDRGSDGQTICDAAHDALKGGYHNKPVILVGYSRGAAYCMYIAEQAQKWGAVIDIMFMFDAVARQREFAIPDKIPKNVKLCYHAYRDPRAGSRYFFQNVGFTREDTATILEKKMFFGSHGAIGGVSWDAAADEYGGTVGNATFKVDDRQHLNIPRQPVTNRAADDACADEVGTWMWKRLAANGVVAKGADPRAVAPPYGGSRTPGARNVIR